MALDCLKHAFFAHFMSERKQLFNLELKILFRFDIEMKRCVLFKLLCAQKKNQTTTLNILVL
jgi:hypothetical protein